MYSKQAQKNKKKRKNSWILCVSRLYSQEKRKKKKQKILEGSPTGELFDLHTDDQAQSLAHRMTPSRISGVAPEMQSREKALSTMGCDHKQTNFKK